MPQGLGSGPTTVGASRLRTPSDQDLPPTLASPLFPLRPPQLPRPVRMALHFPGSSPEQASGWDHPNPWLNSCSSQGPQNKPIRTLGSLHPCPAAPRLWSQPWCLPQSSPSNYSWRTHPHRQLGLLNSILGLSFPLKAPAAPRC